jgi:hypothetical protein
VYTIWHGVDWPAVLKTPGLSIYEVEKYLGMQYRRAHDHAGFLIQTSKIRGQAIMDCGRRKTKLYPAYGVTWSAGIC